MCNQQISSQGHFQKKGGGALTKGLVHKGSEPLYLSP